MQLLSLSSIMPVAEKNHEDMFAKFKEKILLLHWNMNEAILSKDNNAFLSLHLDFLFVSVCSQIKEKERKQERDNETDKALDTL